MGKVLLMVTMYVELQVGQASGSLRLQTWGDGQENAVTLEGRREPHASGEGAAGAPPLINHFPPGRPLSTFLFAGRSDSEEYILIIFYSGIQAFQFRG